jgi:hypothetical protein
MYEMKGKGWIQQKYLDVRASKTMLKNKCFNIQRTVTCIYEI